MFQEQDIIGWKSYKKGWAFMAVYGIGAAYGGHNDKTDEFIKNNCACIGWKDKEEPSLHKMLSKIKISDLIYIKSMSIVSKELIVKAVGIVVDDTIENKVNLEWASPLSGYGREAKKFLSHLRCIKITFLIIPYMRSIYLIYKIE